jgi:alpha-1,6-mannosyltransferase
MLVVPPLGSRDVYSYACQGISYGAGLNPYQVGVSALPCPWLDSISVIWRDSPAPYGPLFVLLASAVVKLGGSLTTIIALFRLIAVAGVVLTGLCLPVLARRCGIPAERAVWLALASPLVALHFIAGAHSDALMLGLIAAGLALIVTWPGRPGPLLLGGILLAMAVAIKAIAIGVLPFAALAAVAGPFRVRSLIRDGGWVAAGAIATFVGVTLWAGLGIGWIAGISGGGVLVWWTSPPTAVGMTTNYIAWLFGADIDAVGVTRTIGVILLAVTLVVLWFRAIPGEGRPAYAPLYGAALAMVATVAFSPLVHPWYMTWPLVLLAATTLRTGWIVAVCAVSAFMVMPDGSGLVRYVKGPGAILMTLYVIWWTVRYVRRTRAAGKAVEHPEAAVPG